MAPPAENTTALLTAEQVPVEPVEAQDWTRQNLHVHVGASGEQYRFRDAWRRLNGRGSSVVSKKGSGNRERLIAGGERQPAAGIGVDNLTQLVKARSVTGFAASLIVRARRWRPL